MPHDERRRIDTGRGILLLEVFEDGVPPRFRLRSEGNLTPASVLGGRAASIETERPGGARQNFRFADRGAFLEFGRGNSRAACVQGPLAARGP